MVVFMGGRLIVIQDVQDARAIGQKVDEQGEQDGEGEEFHMRVLGCGYIKDIDNPPIFRQASCTTILKHIDLPLKPPSQATPR